jgi:Ser/Thr protein kinase RdoA (MazF antagonist)
MRGSLGEKIGKGNAAEIFAWAPGRVVKLFRPGASSRFGQHEARMTRAVFAAGGPAPQVLDVVMLEDRFGMVLPRLDGPTLQERLVAGAVTHEEVGAILAELYLAVHKTPAPPEVVSLRNWIANAARVSGDVLPEQIAAGVLSMIDQLPPEDGLCHADLHPGNVIMTADGPKIIDWACTLRAGVVFDIARAHITLTELVAEDIDPERPRAINAAIQANYARLTGLSDAALTAAMAPYLLILRAFVILQRRPMSPAQREQLIGRIASALLSED